MWAALGVTEFRKQRRMSISDLASRSDLSRVTIYAVERGEPAMLDTLVRVASALEVSLSDISPDAAKVLESVA